MKYFIVSDVHGCYDALIQGLNEAGFDMSDPEHVFVSLGDLFDRGTQNIECLKFVNELPAHSKILIYGNHEFYLQDAITRRYFKGYDVHNETDKTCWEFYKSIHPDATTDDVSQRDILTWLESWKPLKEYLDSLEYFKVVGNNVFVHGWVPYWCRSLDDLNNTDWVDWYDAVWEDGPRCWSTQRKLKTTNKKDAEIVTVFCGHKHSFMANKIYHKKGELNLYDIEEDKDILVMDNSPFIDEGIVNLDSCSFITNKVNVYILVK